MSSEDINIYQIFYNEHTYAKLDCGFIPLDNTENRRPDWFEFWVIRNFLLGNSLAVNGWYGFLSPSFGQKTSLTAHDVTAFVSSCRHDQDVAILPHCWDEIAYFLSPFEQGNLVHEGIGGVSAKVLSKIGIKQTIGDLVTHSGSFTFSNYIVAKPAYWAKWLAMADVFFWLAEKPTNSLHPELTKAIRYRSMKDGVQLKVFIQERLPALLLSDGSLRTSTYDVSATGWIRDGFSSPGRCTRRILRACDLLKKQYHGSGGDKALRRYLELRKLITVRYA